MFLVVLLFSRLTNRASVFFFKCTLIKSECELSRQTFSLFVEDFPTMVFF